MEIDFQDEEYVDLLQSNLLVPHYLMHCFLYYEVCRPIIDDHQFDMIAQRLHAEWAKVKHVHKKILNRAALKSGGSWLKKKYPLRVKQAALSLISPAPTESSVGKCVWCRADIVGEVKWHRHPDAKVCSQGCLEAVEAATGNAEEDI